MSRAIKTARINEDSMRGPLAYRDEMEISKRLKKTRNIGIMSLIICGLPITLILFGAVLYPMLFLFLLALVLFFSERIIDKEIYFGDPRMGLYDNGIQINTISDKIFIRYDQIERLERKRIAGIPYISILIGQKSAEKVKIPLFVIGQDGLQFLVEKLKKNSSVTTI